jgi:hypothetical protein
MRAPLEHQRGDAEEHAPGARRLGPRLGLDVRGGGVTSAIARVAHRSAWPDADRGRVIGWAVYCPVAVLAILALAVACANSTATLCRRRWRWGHHPSQRRPSRPRAGPRRPRPRPPKTRSGSSPRAPTALDKVSPKYPKTFKALPSARGSAATMPPRCMHGCSRRSGSRGPTTRTSTAGSSSVKRPPRGQSGALRDSEDVAEWDRAYARERCRRPTARKRKPGPP